jgi:hypothetical protein
MRATVMRATVMQAMGERRVAAKLNMHKSGSRRGLTLLAALLLLAPASGLAVQTTTVQGVVYRADGTVAQGTMLVSWPSFTGADGSAIAAGSRTAVIAADGSVSMTLAPNAGANPQGTYYTVVYHMNDGTVEKEYWVVPQAATATISQMRARVVPAAVAQQSVTQQYVDTSIGALSGSFLQLKGGTMSGVLNLSSDPASPMQAATKAYVDAHSGAQLPQAQNVIAGKGDGSAVSLAEKGVVVTGSNGLVAWDDDLNAGIYDPRDPRWAGGVFGSTPAAAAQAMSNQMACDLAMGKVRHATAKWPQGNFLIDQLQLAPGSDWEGAPQAEGGTMWHSQYNNHRLATAPASMTVTCSDGKSYTDSIGFTHVQHFTLVGCGNGGCTNAAGETANYQVAGPGNVGLNMATNGVVEHVYAANFGGYGIKMSGQDDKIFHSRVASNDEWYLYGSYKGVNESAASAEVSATTTGTTGSVALSWPAVPSATGYVIYRGSRAGGESGFYMVGSNSFTDTGATIVSGAVTNVVTNALGAPGAVTAAPSTTGGNLAAGTYYYKITATTADGWHGSIELGGLDGMADWIEAYGFFDVPNVYNYHHLADILGGGGDSHYDHLWPQLGQVGIAQPYGSGFGDVYSNVRIDFTRLEGFYTNDSYVTVVGGQIDGSCTGSNAVTINTGQEGARFAGECNQYWATGGADNLSNVWFSDNAGYGPTYKTADIMSEGGDSSVRNVGAATYQFVPVEGFRAGHYWDSHFNSAGVGVDPTYGTVDVNGLTYVTITATTPTSTWAFTNTRFGQDFYVAGGNSNVTLLYDGSHLITCSGKNVNLGTVTGYLHFLVTQVNSDQGYGAAYVSEVCQPPQPTIASSETVAFSATPTFSITTRSSVITLSGNVTSFTLAAGVDGEEKTLTFCQNATGGFTVTPPGNVRGFFTVGTTAGKCSSQHFTYSTAQSAWLADSPGATNE